MTVGGIGGWRAWGLGALSDAPQGSVRRFERRDRTIPSDFGIVAPNIGGFIVSIADEGALEFVVVLGRS